MLHSSPIEVFSDNDAVSKWHTAYNTTYELLLGQLTRHVLGAERKSCHPFRRLG